MSKYKRKNPILTTTKDCFIAVDILTKELGRGVSVAEVAGFIFSDRKVAGGSKEYNAVYNRMRILQEEGTVEPIPAEMKTRTRGGIPVFWKTTDSNGNGNGDRTIAHSVYIQPQVRAPAAAPTHDELRGHLAKIIEALETLQDHINPSLVLLLDLEKDYERFTKAREALTLLRSQIAEVNF